MKTKKVLLLAVLVLMALWAGIFVVYHLGQIGSRVFTYSNYDLIAKTLVSVVSLTTIGAFLLSVSGAKSGNNNYRAAIYAFLFTLLLGCGAVLLANPDGIFPWGNSPFYLRVAGRTIKPRLLYSAAGPPFDTFIFGSSRAFSFPTEPLAEHWNLNGLNMSVEAASAVDFYVLANMINNFQEPPKLLIAEVGQPVVANNSWKTSPLAYVPVLPLDKSLPITWNAVRSTISLSAITDSIYLLAFPNSQPPFITFNQRGYYLREMESERVYEKRLGEAKDIFARLRCNSLDEVGVEYIEQFVAEASANKTGVVFYRSPLNSDFIETINVNNPAYALCERLITGFFEALAANNPNVRFIDLAYYEPIAQLGRTGFIDVWHLTSYGAELVVEALGPDIQAALDWVEVNQER